MTKRSHSEVEVDVGDLLQKGKRPESELPEAVLTEKLAKIQETVWEGSDNFTKLEVLLKEFNTAQRGKELSAQGVSSLKTVEALTYALEVCSTGSTLALTLNVLDILTRDPAGVEHAVYSATERMAVKILKADGSPELQVAGLQVLANMCSDSAGGEEGLSAVIAAGVHQVALAALRLLPQSAAGAGAGLKVLRNLTRVDDVAAAVLGGGALDLAVTAMKRFPSDEAVQAHACGLFGHLAMCDEVAGVPEAIIGSGAVEMAAAALKRFPDSAIVQEAGLGFWLHVADLEEAQAAILQGGRVGLAVAALKGHPDRPHVLEPALGLLQAMALSDEGQYVLLAGRSVQLAAARVKENAGHEGVLEAGLGFLQNVTFECQEGAGAALANDSIAAAAAALRGFPDNAAIQEAGLGLLRNLADSAAGRPQVHSAGAQLLAAAAARAHPRHEGVQEAALAFL